MSVAFTPLQMAHIRHLASLLSARIHATPTPPERPQLATAYWATRTLYWAATGDPKKTAAGAVATIDAATAWLAAGQAARPAQANLPSDQKP